VLIDGFLSKKEKAAKANSRLYNETPAKFHF